MGSSGQADSTSASKAIAQQFDACASWWTQGPDTTLQVIYQCKFLSMYCALSSFIFLDPLKNHNINV